MKTLNFSHRYLPNQGVRYDSGSQQCDNVEIDEFYLV